MLLNNMPHGSRFASLISTVATLILMVTSWHGWLRSAMVTSVILNIHMAGYYRLLGYMTTRVCWHTIREAAYPHISHHNIIRGTSSVVNRLVHVKLLIKSSLT